jgi:hypothetical protein
MIAAFGNFYVAKVAWGQAETRRGEIRNEVWTLMDIHERGRRWMLDAGCWMGWSNDRFGSTKLFRPTNGFGFLVRAVGLGFLDLCEPRADLLPGFGTLGFWGVWCSVFGVCAKPSRSPRHRLPHDVRNMCYLVNAHEPIHLREQPGQFIAKPLRQDSRTQ